MYRTVMEQLQKWKAKKHRKPLVIRGARQVGKTWLMKAFGAAEYESVVYINFDNNERMRNLFEGSLAVERLVTGLELYAGHKIDPANTLLIFDEVQEVPTALTSLKYFNEDAPQYQIICAGSLLGVALHQGTSFPVGKVEFLDLYPLSFSEFLMAMGKDRYVELLLMDTICRNADRHTYNYGLLRNQQTGEVVSLAPNFDNNIALISGGMDDGPRRPDLLTELLEEFEAATGAVTDYTARHEIPTLTPELIAQCCEKTGIPVDAEYMQQFVLAGWSTTPLAKI